MSKAKSNRVYEISDSVSLAKLSGLQLSITSLEQMSQDLQRILPEKRGIVAACNKLAERVFTECVTVNERVKKEEIEPDEAKIRINQIQIIVNILKESGVENHKDMVAMENKSAGYLEAADRLSKQYDDLAVKYERDERIEKENEEENAESLDELEKLPTKKAENDKELPAKKDETQKKEKKKTKKKEEKAPKAPKGKKKIDGKNT